MPDDSEPIARIEDYEPGARARGASTGSSNGHDASEFTEDALASQFTARHEHELRYVVPWGAWLRWDGTRWNFEKTHLAFDLARQVAREAYADCGKLRVASAAAVAAIEKLARADRRHAATVEQWDVDPWLLNTPGGIVDLRTGNMLPHDPKRYMTKITAVAPDGDCPLWLTFLDRITAGDTEVQQFLHRALGYALTGSVREHALFFAFGHGANGKGVCFNTVTKILADYAAVAPMETFIATQGERHPTDLAGLRGARLVTAQETERGRRWAESKVKALTGGDPITARFMRQDFFTFEPNFKLVIAGNHKPGLSGVDEAIRRRFYLIPFTVTIPEAERDKELSDKLRAEWPGILQWMIEGCLAWQRGGLLPPAAVRDATTIYLDEEDALGRWIDDRCIPGKTFWCSTGHLWQSWKGWAEVNNEPPGSNKSFGIALDERGFEASRNQGMRGRNGISLRASARYDPSAS